MGILPGLESQFDPNVVFEPTKFEPVKFDCTCTPSKFMPLSPGETTSVTSGKASTLKGKEFYLFFIRQHPQLNITCFPLGNKFFPFRVDPITKGEVKLF